MAGKEKISGYDRFEFYMLKLEELLKNAAKEKNPALWLYTNNARTVLFMLESLAKLYTSTLNNKKLGKIKAHFKKLEDVLGAIDYYDVFAKEFAARPLIPNIVTGYLQDQAREKIQSLNEILVEKKWIGDDASRLRKIRKRLKEIEWKDPKDDLKSIFQFYKSSIADIKDFMASVGENFTEIESQVHAVRRKLRWLSIYPQSLQGCIQLNESTLEPLSLQKYLTPEIVNSPFNKMPLPGANRVVLLLEKNYFLALSWMIAELGKLKDDGLRILVVAEAIQQVEGTGFDDALDKSFETLSTGKDALPAILKKATSLCKDFFDEKILDKLVFGVTTTK